MEQNIILKKLFSFILLVTAMNAVDIIREDGSTTYNEVDNNYKAEKGWRFYQDSFDENLTQKEPDQGSTNSGAGKNGKDEIAALLQQILKENQKQTKLQTEIRDMLKEQTDPPAQIITRADGTTCVANSSADCFKMPLTPESKRVPAMRAWLENGDEESAINYLQWQAKYFKEVFGRGDVLQFAVLNQGTKAYPMNYWDSGFSPVWGHGKVLKDNRALNTLQNYAGELDFIIFIGENTDMDIFSMDKVGNFITSLPDRKINLVFSSKGALKLYEEGASAIPPLKRAWVSKQVTKTVDQKLFKEYGIYTTPTTLVRIVDNGKMKTQIVSVGKVSKEEASEKTINYLRHIDLLDYEQDAGYKVWQEKKENDYSSDHLYKAYRLDLNQTKVKELLEQ